MILNTLQRLKESKTNEKIRQCQHASKHGFYAQMGEGGGVISRKASS